MTITNKLTLQAPNKKPPQALKNKLLLLTLMLCSLAAHAAELTIEINQGQDNPTAIAIVPFDSGRLSLSENVVPIINGDLKRSGLFEPLAKEDMLSQPHERKDVFFRDWNALDVEFLVVGRIKRGSEQRLEIQFELFDVVKQKRVMVEKISGAEAQLRDMAHIISDKVYEQVTGVPGAFNTRIVYVSAASREEKRLNFRLMRADSDGAREKLILESEEPILSPTWSPDAKEIAYVSFESGRPAIYRQNLATGERDKLTNFRGLNSAPAWSPDGKKMAMVLSKDGSPDIYVMDLASKQLKRLTRNSAIDTEPGWSPDGQSIIFTSDRGRKPQIYKVTLATGRIERLTFEGDYNARATMRHDGNGLIMVHRSEGAFHIAELDFKSERTNVLTRTSLDESPSLAPNDSMIIYATQQNRRGILAAVSVDGNVKYILPATNRDVREPAWSPLLSK
ncbi:MAG: Tol-Pal system beta propeller repeat protein TolB [Pseudomonadales bacterium]